MRLPLLVILFAALSAGAVEIQVEGLQDSLAGPPAINHCTLRKAVANANGGPVTYAQCPSGSPGLDTITFLFPGTITFALPGIMEELAATGDLDVTEDLTIQGHPSGTVIDAADLDRIFDVKPGATLTLIDIHLRNGTGLGGAGAISVNTGGLHLDRVTISGCHGDEGDGGAIISSASTVTINNSTISGNTADHHAGAIVIESGSAVITHSTIAGNSSGFSNLTGGIRSTGATTLQNTIVVGNAGNDLPNLDGAFTSLGYNVIGELGLAYPANPQIVANTGDQLDVGHAQVSLGALQNNGGPVPTRALLGLSIARDKGNSFGETIDQRGALRPCDDPAFTNAPGGDGADVGAYEEQGTCGANAPPDAVDDNFAVSEDSGANALDVLANDSDPDTDPLTIVAVTQGAHGGVTFTAGSVSYTPDANYFGPDSFTYTIDDGNGETDTATVLLAVANVQDAPNAIDDNFAVFEDSGPTAFGVLANDGDVDGDSLSVTAVTQPANGSATFTAGSVSYTPNPNYFGADSFTYTIADGNGGHDTATVLVAVSNVNDAPVAVADAFAMNQDTVLNGSVLGNDSDVDGDALTAVLGVSVSNGTLVLNADGSFVYTPSPGFAGTDSFTYTAHDGTTGSNVATVTIQVADTQAPTITASVATNALWSPNHKLVDVGLTFSATDNSSAVTTSFVVYSDEDDGATPDAAGSLLLRAERAGAGDGRFYLIRITASDAYGNTSHSCLTVIVPRSQSAADVAAVQAQAAAAQSACSGAGLFVVGN